jgi:hypothetical protein
LKTTQSLPGLEILTGQRLVLKNNADSDTDSYMWFETGDNGNEYFNGEAARAPQQKT